MVKVATSNIGRVTSSMSLRHAQKSRGDIATLLAEHRRKAASGISVGLPSDDPVAWLEAANCRADHLKFALQQKSINEQKRYLETAQYALDQIDGALQEVTAAGVLAGRIVVTSQDFAALRVSVRAAKEKILTNLNAESGGVYVFSGGNRQDKPFAERDVVVDGAAPDGVLNLKYHGQQMHVVTAANLQTADALHAVTQQTESLKVGLLGQEVDVAVRGAEICGNEAFNYRTGAHVAGGAGPFAANTISGDCYSVLGKIEALLGQLQGAPQNQPDLDDLGRCMVKVEDIRQKNVMVASAHVWSLQKTLDDYAEAIENNLGETRGRHNDLVSWKEDEGTSEIAALTVQERVNDEVLLQILSRASHGPEYLRATKGIL
ncbi:hypothetical protein FACS1894198_4750 [Clostridia bacterium]|nr:hypothetical protein FACS1894198_4750 [Clostridia bacterium]